MIRKGMFSNIKYLNFKQLHTLIIKIWFINRVGTKVNILNIYNML